jgi:hypothetical protein
MGMSISSIWLQVFFPRTWEEKCWEFSGEAKQLLEEMAACTGDPLVLNWIKANPAFQFDGAVSGYVRPPRDGDPIRIGLKRELFAKADSCHTRFAAGHELGHVRQLLQNEAPGKLFTRKLYRQEMEASAFAATALERCGCHGARWWYTSPFQRFVCATEAAFPVISHLAKAVVFGTAGYALGRLTGFHNWLADRLESLADPADIPPGERV